MTGLQLERAVDAVLRVTATLEIQFLSESGKRWLARPFQSSQLPNNFLEFLHTEDVAVVQKAIQGLPQAFACDVRVGVTGSHCWIHFRSHWLAAAGQYVLSIVDISAWKTEASNLRHAADHDELTGLANRASLKRSIAACIQKADPFTVALLDLDGFKRVNDTFGHQTGDAVLVETTKRLKKVLGSQGVLARLGGDEFVLLLPGKNVLDAKQVLKNVLTAIARPYDAAPHNAYLGVSAGIAEFPTHGEDYSALLKNADTAMYQSKNAGKNRVTVFSATQSSPDFSITSAMHKGIQEGEFYLDYQPQFDMHRRLVGAEALMRWTNRKLGPIGPNVFIPIAETSGLMPFLGNWALRSACHQLKSFQSVSPDFVMSVNVSPIQFDGDHFDKQVIDVIEESGVDPHRLVLEITESTLMHSQERTERSLANLREKGVRFSIDDFGTGFSSLSYLTRLPVSSIKIDKAFVWAIEAERTSATSNQRLIKAMIHLGQSIDLRVVAEGVETEAQFEFLKVAGCDLIQGFLLGKPMSAQVMHKHLVQQCTLVA